MALGALTLTSSKTNRQGLKLDVISLVGPASYTSGGDTGLQAALRAETNDQREILAVYDIGLNGGYVSRYDYANAKLMHLLGNGVAVLAEASGDLHTTTFKLLVISI